ncbi:MAG TPA: L-threonylcarbamoyladenylate synthase [Burkholderiaceae bacterium]|nr:L-threonylcarbamoyladenylate synthase [Burkholderiaceae bacterium]
MAVIVPADAAHISLAVRVLREGGVVAMPTETVYGLAADATNDDAVRRIFTTKGRPADHPVIVHIASSAAIDDWAVEVPPEARRLAHAFWPGPLTLVLKRAAHVSDLITGGQATVGLRCPAHPVAQALLAALAEHHRPSGLAAPSANPFGRISPTSAWHVAADHPASDLLVLDGGECGFGIESTIIDASRMATDGLVLLRPGALDVEPLAASAGAPIHRRLAAHGQAPRVSGALASHYAPRKPLRLVRPDELKAVSESDAARYAVLTIATELPAHPWAWSMHAENDPHTYAHGLYAWLRAMDASTASQLLVEWPPAMPEWDAVHDRLRRAATA